MKLKLPSILINVKEESKTFNIKSNGIIHQYVRSSDQNNKFLHNQTTDYHSVPIEPFYILVAHDDNTTRQCVYQYLM